MSATMRFTTFASIKTSTPVTYEGWPSFLEQFEVRETDDKKSVPLYCPAEFANNRRLIANILHVNFGVMDIDRATEEEVNAAIAYLVDELGLEVLVHSTHSHMDGMDNKGLFKCRIIIPFSRPVESDEWDRIWQGMNDLIGGIADEQCKNPNAIYFFPSCPVGQVERAFIDHYNEGGNHLDIDMMLEVAPDVPKKLSAIPAPDPAHLKKIESSTRYKLAKAFIETKFQPLVGKGHRNQAAFRVAMTCGDFALSAKEARPLLLDWNSTLVFDEETEEGGPLDESELDSVLRSAYERNSDEEFVRRSTPFGWRLVDRVGGDAVTSTHLKDRAKKHSKKEGRLGVVARWLEKMLKGDAFGPEAESCFGAVAHFIAVRFPSADANALAVLLEKSLTATHNAGHKDVSVEWMAEHIAKAQVQWHENEADEMLELQERERDIIRDAFRSVGIQNRTTAYTKSDLRRFAEESGMGSAQDLRRRWIIRFKKYYYFFVAGQYTRAYEDGEASNMAHEALRPARLNLYKQGNTGPVPLRMTELVERYGTVANKIHTDLSAQRSIYDADKKLMIEAPCPFRDLEPERSELTEAWLCALADEDEMIEGLILDWLACLPMLTRPNSAIFFHGKAHAGKGLFAEGCARLWIEPGKGTITELETLAGGFNQKVEDCPVVFGDEFIPRDRRGDPDTQLLRRLIQERSRTFKRKHRPDTTLIGACRYIIAANSENVLINRFQDLTNNDIEAIAERVLSISIRSDKAANLLKSYTDILETEQKGLYELEDMLEACKKGSDDYKACKACIADTKATIQKYDDFFNGDTIPKHIWWLHHNRRVSYGSRFLVAGLPNSTLTLKLMTSAGRRGEICEFLTEYLLADPEKQRLGKDDRPFVDEGHDGTYRFLVTAKMLHRLWSQFTDTEKPRSSTVLERALKGMVQPNRVKKQRKHYYHAIDWFRVKYWALLNGYGEVDIDEALERLGLPIPEVPPHLIDVEEDDEKKS